MADWIPAAIDPLAMPDEPNPTAVIPAPVAEVAIEAKVVAIVVGSVVKLKVFGYATEKYSVVETMRL
jgi:hypothetical protein